MLHCHVTTLDAIVFLFSEKDPPKTRHRRHCYQPVTDRQLHQSLEMAPGTENQPPHQPRSSPPSTFLRLQGELCEAPCKRAGLPSQTASGEQKRTCCGSAAACAPRLQKAAPLLRPGAHSLQGQGVKNRSQLSFKAILCAVKHIRE